MRGYLGSALCGYWSPNSADKLGQYVSSVYLTKSNLIQFKLDGQFGFTEVKSG